MDEPLSDWAERRDARIGELRAVPVDANRRLRALHELQDLVRDGALDTGLLLDKRNYRGETAR
ncbi:DUF6087 family protein [Streptomyces sp. cmx-18-6]|uniref:DUF6087 family protein n=1 Tax=Streptomyces sp. cmx-18-6 TaxID=2790930 RepID=UPI003980011E